MEEKNGNETKQTPQINQIAGNNFDSVLRYASTPKGIDLSRMEKLEGRFGHNRSGRGCDVQRGPCSCGAWH